LRDDFLEKPSKSGQIAASVKRNAGSLLCGDILLFDVYQGEHLPESKKSYAIGFTLQDNEKNSKK
jgi:phenylalanyl-tRNA synthetase beta subunit